MKIDVCSKNSVYIELNGWTYYIDDSTGEQIQCKWKTENKEDDIELSYGKLPTNPL